MKVSDPMPQKPSRNSALFSSFRAWLLIGSACAACLLNVASAETKQGKTASPVEKKPSAKKKPPAPTETKPEATTPAVANHSELPPLDPERKLEPMCVVFEPAILRTTTSKAVKGSKLTVLTPAEETKDGIRLLTEEQFQRVGLSWEAYLGKARDAAARLLKTIKPDYARDKRGTVLRAVIRSPSHFTCSVVLCPEFRQLFADTLGNDLVVLLPDRFTVFVFSRAMGEFPKSGAEVAAIYSDSVYQASSEAFQLNEDTFIPIGSFDVGQDEAPSTK